MSDLTAFVLRGIEGDEAPTYELVPYACEPGCCAPAGWVGSRCLICDDGVSYGGTVQAMTESAKEHAERIHRRSRTLAECRAKRAILETYALSAEESEIHCDAWTLLKDVVASMAGVYVGERGPETVHGPRITIDAGGITAALQQRVASEVAALREEGRPCL